MCRAHSPRLLPAILACAIALVATGCSPRAPEEPAWSIESGEILFTARRDGNTDLYRFSPTALVPIRVTRETAAEHFGRYSPDGTRIAFQSQREGKIDIFVIKADGTEPINLTSHPDYDVLPAWSPDGTRIAFMSTRGFEPGALGPFPGHVYVMNADGSELRQVTKEPLSSSLGPQDWTPDGRGILLSRLVDGNLDLFLLDVGSGEEIQLTTDPAGEYGAAFSRNGSRIALHAESGDESHLVVMNRYGGERRRLTSGPGRRYGPRWSPDDQWLVFTVQGAVENDYDIRLLRLADGFEKAVVATAEDEREPDWVPLRNEGRTDVRP